MPSGWVFSLVSGRGGHALGKGFDSEGAGFHIGFPLISPDEGQCHHA